jgi:hypothetical protein
MPRFLYYVMLLALVVWLGGIIFFGAVMAPVLFSTLPKRELAGAVVTRALTALHYIGIGAGLIFLFASVARSFSMSGSAQLGWNHLLIVVMLAGTLVSQFVVSKKMVALRRDMVEIDSIAATDPRRVEFNKLHRFSTGLEEGVLLLGLIVLWGVAGESGARRLS